MNIEKPINILATIIGLQVSYSVEEQLNTTEELYYKNYKGENPLLKESKDLGVYTQVETALKGIAYETFNLIRNSEVEIRMSDYAYLGYSKGAFESMTKKLTLTKAMSLEENLEYRNNLEKIVAVQNIGIMRKILMIMIVMLKYDQIEVVSSLAYYLHISSKLCKE